MKTINVPSDEDLETAAREKYTQRCESRGEKGRRSAPTWDELREVEREDEINMMRAAFAAGPKVAEALGLRAYSQQVPVPEVGQTVIYKGWPAVVTLTCDSADAYDEPARAQKAFPALRDELSVHLHVLSAVGPYPAHGVQHGRDGWLWPDEAAADLAKRRALDAIRRERASGA
ncbi:hypothetical protein ACFUJX_20045 [Streptomyces rubiginosohelvolus]|uniref:hypothetical protein n=1 Tax=Streptomyces rubiginosohelvolus TaxID=67362 RepID=UPI00362D0FC0